jgi:hypothetical protein
MEREIINNAAADRKTSPRANSLAMAKKLA